MIENNIDEERAKIIGESLMNNTTLKELYLQSNERVNEKEIIILKIYE